MNKFTILVEIENLNEKVKVVEENTLTITKLSDEITKL